MAKYGMGFSDSKSIVRNMETSGQDKIGGAALIYKYLDNALYWETWCHKAPNHFINAVEACERIMLIPLLKGDAYTGQDFEATWDLINRFRIANDSMVSRGGIVRLPMPLIVAKAKLSRNILRCKDLFDTQYYGEIDWAVEGAAGADPAFDLNKGPTQARNKIPQRLQTFGGIDGMD